MRRGNGGVRPLWRATRVRAAEEQFTSTGKYVWVSLKIYSSLNLLNILSSRPFSNCHTQRLLWHAAAREAEGCGRGRWRGFPVDKGNERRERGADSLYNAPKREREGAFFLVDVVV